MKKLLSVFVALTFVLSLAAVAVAADKPAAAPAAPAKAAEPAKKAEPMKKEAAPMKAEAKKAAPKAKQITGTLEALDAAKGTFSVKGKKETVELKAGEKVKLDGLAVGDKVLVKYAEGTASSVKKVPAKAEAKKAEPKKEAAAPKAEMKKEAAPMKAEPMKKEAAPAAPAKK